jgi:hypothetical protein
MSEAKPTKHYKPKQTLADMSDAMATALVHCTSRGLRPDEWGDDCRWSLVTRDALLRHGLIHLTQNRKGKDTYRPTDSGRAVVAAHAPRLLMPTARPRRVDEQGSCYTHIPGFAMYGEPEAT